MAENVVIQVNLVGAKVRGVRYDLKLGCPVVVFERENELTALELALDFGQLADLERAIRTCLEYPGPEEPYNPPDEDKWEREEEEEYNYYADDLAFDAARERSVFGR